MDITNELFLEMISDFEDCPIWLKTKDGWTSELYYDKVIGDFVRMRSGDKPRLLKFSEITEISFEAPEQSAPETVIVKQQIPAHTVIAAQPAQPVTLQDQIRKKIWLHSFAFEDRSAEIQNGVRNTPLEKEWARMQNILTNARKNHVLPEKAEGIISHLEDFPAQCIELCKMTGIAFAAMDDFANASLQYEIAGDYQNAAYYAAKCGENSREYLVEVFRKWLVTGREISKDVLASFFCLCSELHRGRYCAETIRQLPLRNHSEEIRNILYFGLLSQLSDYLTDREMPEIADADDDRIADLLERLRGATVSEDYTADRIEKLLHANELFDGKNDLPDKWGDDVLTGYIVSSPQNGYGFINENQNNKTGIYFNISSCSGQLAALYPQHYRSLRGLKVVYKLATAINQGKKQTVAVNVEAAEDISAFLPQTAEPASPQEPDNTPPEDKLIRLPEENRYRGYILYFNGSFGFIHKEPHTAKRGVFFYVKDLDDKLRPYGTYGSKLNGLKVTCSLAESYKSDADKSAVRISADEDIDRFMISKGIAPEIKQNLPEIVDDDAITAALQSKPAPAVVQEYATTNKPFHALAALERSKDSFSYDKYVKRKIQLLQRTKSSDNELIQLLNYTITTSLDGAYIAHNLFFLGQVQYRCKQYSDVVVTMKQLEKYKSYIKTPSQYPDSIYLMAVSYYMMQDYTNADQCAGELQKLGAHSEDVAKLLNRTFASEAHGSDRIDDLESEASLQLDTEVAMTQYIEKLIDRFSFGSISVGGVPSDFDPWSSECSLDLANNYIRRLIRYDSRSEQKNNPNAAIAIAKIQKWIIQQSSEEEKETVERSLRNNVSRALQIIARNTLQQSGLDLRVNLFFRMQQHKMSIREQKEGLFNAYINAHYGFNEMRSLRLNSKLRDVNFRLMMSDILLFRSSLDISETADEKERIRRLCELLGTRDDAAQYRKALTEILTDLRCSFDENADLFALTELGSEAMENLLNATRKAIRSKAESRQWDELSDTLQNFLAFSFITQHEHAYIEKVIEVIGYIDSVARNTQTAMKQNLLNQSRNQLDELSDDLEVTPTYILYSIFGDMLGILKNETLTMLAEVMSHTPNIEPVGSLQINVGLTDSGEFLLPLEFQNLAPAVQAKNLTFLIEHVTPGVSLQSHLPIGQNVDEGEKYSQSLPFRLDAPEIQQIEISVRLEYSYDAFDNLKQANERRNGTKSITYTVSFQDVPKLANRYREYAKQQTVKDKTMFFGREQIIAKLFEAVSVRNQAGGCNLRGGNGIVLYGQRRSGKTSILYHLKEKFCRDMQRTVVVDLGSSGKAISNTGSSLPLSEEELQNRNASMTMETLYHLIVSGIQSYIEDNRFDMPAMAELYDRIGAYEQAHGKSVFPDTEAFLSGMNCQLLFNEFIKRFSVIARPEDTENGFRIVILIDEFTYFNAAIQQGMLPQNFMEIWKGIVSDSFISLIVAGQDNMVEFIEGYVNEFSSFHREWVTFLSRDASYKMVTEPIGTDRIDPDAADKLYRITAGSPFLLMDICAELVDWMNENKILKLSGSQPEDFLVGKYMKEYGFKQDLFEPQYKDAGRLDWTDSIKKALGLIARSTSKKVSSESIPWNEFDQYALIRDDALEDRGINTSRMHEILERLVKRQVIETQEGYQNRYRIKIPLCREWILRRGGAEYGNE